jgi:squalene cyclase
VYPACPITGWSVHPWADWISYPISPQHPRWLHPLMVKISPCGLTVAQDTALNKENDPHMRQKQLAYPYVARANRGSIGALRHEAYVGKKNAQLATRHDEAGLRSQLMMSGMRRGTEIYKLRRFASRKRGAGAKLAYANNRRGAWGEARSSSSSHVIYGACNTRLRTSIPN